MKKIIFILLALFVFIPASQGLAKFYIGEKVPNMHIESVRDIGVHNGVPFILTREDGQFVYCIERPKDINVTDYYKEYYHNDKQFNLTDEMLERINLLGYYGYKYQNHTDIKWYGVTQFLIWKTLYGNVYFTDTRYGKKIDAYVSEINEIENLVNSYYKLPSFSNNSFEYSINSKYEILDTNNVLNNFEIKASNIDSYISDNKLYIETKEEGIYEISFIKRNPAKNDYILYGLSGWQPLILPGKARDIEFKISIKVDSGSITINKFDSENIERKNAILEGAEYGIYNEEELITTIKTNEEGVAYIDKLPLGKYYVKEINPSLGYKLDKNIYEINLTNKDKDVVINSYEEVIKGNLIINKYYGEDNNYKKEDGAVFEIYDINDNLIGAYQTKNGIINESLEYGEYYAIQTKGIFGYKFVDKFNISVKEEKDYIFDLYNKKDILVVNVPNTKVKNYNKLISISLILLGLILILKSLKKTTHFE